MRLPPLILLGVLMTSACNQEPSFDARYQAQTAKLGAAANAMALELDNQLNASRAAGRLETDSNAQIPLTSPVAAQ